MAYPKVLLNGKNLFVNYSNALAFLSGSTNAFSK